MEKIGLIFNVFNVWHEKKTVSNKMVLSSYERPSKSFTLMQTVIINQ